jgi:hypothetical protein
MNPGKFSSGVPTQPEQLTSASTPIATGPLWTLNTGSMYSILAISGFCCPDAVCGSGAASLDGTDFAPAAMHSDGAEARARAMSRWRIMTSSAGEVLT